MSLEDVDPLDFYYSPQMDKVRQMMIRGEHITGCEVCYEQESKTDWSYRQDHHKKIEHYGLDYFPTTLKPDPTKQDK